jgi:hypothetical protein
MSVSAAMDRTLQCVDPSWGFVFKVALISLAIVSSEIDRGAPGRGSSYKPAMRLSTNRWRHLPTVGIETRKRSATS